MQAYIQIVTAVSSKEEGERIAHALLDKRLAACVQILGPISSLYWWQGKIERSQEWLCIAKSELELFTQIEEIIQSLHSYTVPEILALPVVQGNESYLQWLHDQIRGERL